MRCHSVIALSAITALSLSAPVFAQGSTAPSATATRAADIVDTAVAAGSFNTLAAALKAANLVDALKGAGPFTVFAPTDEAFAKLPAGTVESLLKPENRDQLVAILKYHVVPGNVPASRVTGMKHAATLNGQRIDIAVKDGAVRIDEATVTTADVRASNGVIHVIDRVILPNTSDIVKTASDNGSFKTLLAAAEAAGLVGALRGEGPFTIFAPTDEAFAALGSSAIETLLKPESRDDLRRILLHHVVAGRVYSDAIKDGMEVTTLAGTTATIAVRGDAVRVGTSRVVKADIDTANGVIHVVDAVIVPK